MSTLLDEAIVEAEALREAAFKSAEAAVIEKYSGQIKEAVEQLLEADLGFGFEEEDEVGIGGEVEDILSQVSTSAEEAPSHEQEGGAKLCICPDTPEGLGSEEEMASDEEQEVASAEPGEEIITLNLKHLEESLAGVTEDELYESLEEEVEQILEIDEADGIAESMRVDIKPTAGGWAGTPGRIMKHKEEQMLAFLQDDDVKEEFEAVNNAVKKLQKENKSLKSTVESSLVEIKSKESHIKKLTEAVTMMKDILEESNVVNARLLYKVRVLESNSLNERQKSQLAERLSEAKSVEEARLIFETLQSSVGSTKRHPESLSEAVERSSSTMLLSRQRESTPDDQAPALDRWKTLAGLK
jgi:hypothetical protein